MTRSRIPSDAQAALLALIAEHETEGREVEWCVTGDHDDYRPGQARLFIEVIDRVANRSHFDSADGHRYQHRVATVKACIRHGWLNDLHQRIVTWPPPTRSLSSRTTTWDLRQLDTTEDGVIALGQWRHRKLNAPVAPIPTLALEDHAIVAAALHAVTLGCRLVPVTDDARQQARRLKREGWVSRGGVGASATCVLPTPIAIVEIDPESADTPLEMPRW